MQWFPFHFLPVQFVVRQGELIPEIVGMRNSSVEPTITETHGMTQQVDDDTQRQEAS